MIISPHTRTLFIFDHFCFTVLLSSAATLQFSGGFLPACVGFFSGVLLNDGLAHFHRGWFNFVHFAGLDGIRLLQSNQAQFVVIINFVCRIKFRLTYY